MSSSPIKIPITEFAPAERMPIDVIHQQAGEVSRMPLTLDALNSLINYVFILNPQRQIVFASNNVRALLPNGNGQEILGKRPGELLGCVHSDDSEGGCGTTIFCQECGAAKAILASLAGRRDIQECHLTRIVRTGDEALDLLVSATPIQVGQETFCLLAILDISHLKRRQALERVFFHDLINYGGGLERLTEMLNEAPIQDIPEETRADLQMLQSGLHDMMEEIRTQRELAAAENGELQVHCKPVYTNAVLVELIQFYRKHPVTQDRRLNLATDSAAVEFPTDPTLLKRVLGNLIKNALEATPSGQIVTAGWEDQGGLVRFSVNNPGIMPRSVQLQIFNRSFTTKGTGRGLGTYSVKLLTERYLGGTVSFTSNPEHPEEGTTFFIILPKRPPR